MRYHLRNAAGLPVDVQDYAEDLDYSRLHHSNSWSVWIVWESESVKIAEVNWSGNSGYIFDDPYAKAYQFIRRHDLIVPLISGCIVYNSIFHRYNEPKAVRMLHVFPESD
jgi:hypothetical protein